MGHWAWGMAVGHVHLGKQGISRVNSKRRQFQDLNLSSATMPLSLQVVVMHAQNLEAANTDLLPAAQVELRAIYADEEIAFQKTTVHPESKTPVLFSIWLEM
jgi:hypothetical protein